MPFRIQGTGRVKAKVTAESLHAVFDDANVVGAFGHGSRRRSVSSERCPSKTLALRVENLERKIDLLESLPERVGAVELRVAAVELQSGHLRVEMREQFSAVRQEFRGEIQGVTRELRGEIQASEEETRRYMSVLHEEVLSRIATIQEGRSRRRSWCCCR